MKLLPWIGVLFFVGRFALGIASVSAERRSGRVDDCGHPMLDQALLLFSGLPLVAALFGVIFWVQGHWQPQVSYWIGLGIMVVFALGITQISNYFLRRYRKAPPDDSNVSDREVQNKKSYGNQRPGPR